MVWNYQNADCSFKNKLIVLFIIIFGTLSFPIVLPVFSLGRVLFGCSGTAARRRRHPSKSSYILASAIYGRLPDPPHSRPRSSFRPARSVSSRRENVFSCIYEALWCGSGLLALLHRAGSMHLSGVRLSVCPSVRPSTGPQQETRRCRFAAVVRLCGAAARQRQQLWAWVIYCMSDYTDNPCLRWAKWVSLLSRLEFIAKPTTRLESV